MQTALMQKQMLQTYPELNGRIVVVPQPAPSWLKRGAPRRCHARGKRLRLFYPAAGFIYKNHSLVKEMDAMAHLGQSTELTVTLRSEELARLGLVGNWVRNVGRVEPRDCQTIYDQSDALFFPSLIESYGLPLVEAMVLGLPVVCSDLPYARWLCEDQAIYFEPSSPGAAWHALETLRVRLESGWYPDWSAALSKLPNDWDDVAGRFLKAMQLQVLEGAATLSGGPGYLSTNHTKASRSFE